MCSHRELGGSRTSVAYVALRGRFCSFHLYLTAEPAAAAVNIWVWPAGLNVGLPSGCFCLGSGSSFWIIFKWFGNYLWDRSLGWLDGRGSPATTTGMMLQDLVGRVLFFRGGVGTVFWGYFKRNWVVTRSRELLHRKWIMWIWKAGLGFQYGVCVLTCWMFIGFT